MIKSLKRSVFVTAAAMAVCGFWVESSPAAQVFYEPFDYTPGDLNLKNNTSVSPADTWTRSGTVAAANIDVAADSLTSPVAAPVGGKVTITNPATASTERLNFPAISSGTVWYSMTFNASVGAATVNTNAGAYFVGLSSLDDNGDVDGGAAPAITNIAARLALRLDPGDTSKLNVALTNTAAQTSASYSGVQLTQGQDVFVIVSYEIAAGAANDVSKLWINPDPGTFTPATAASLTVTGQADLVDVKSFFLRQTGGLPETVNVDEVRVGTDYVDVIPEPTSLAAAGLVAAGLLSRRARRA